MCSRMELGTEGSGREKCDMAMVNRHGQMVRNTLAIGDLIKHMARVLSGM